MSARLGTKRDDPSAANEDQGWTLLGCSAGLALSRVTNWSGMASPRELYDSSFIIAPKLAFATSVGDSAALVVHAGIPLSAPFAS